MHLVACELCVINKYVYIKKYKKLTYGTLPAVYYYYYYYWYKNCVERRTFESDTKGLAHLLVIAATLNFSSAARSCNSSYLVPDFKSLIFASSQPSFNSSHFPPNHLLPPSSPTQRRRERGDRGIYPHQSFERPGLSPPTVWDHCKKYNHVSGQKILQLVFFLVL